MITLRQLINRYLYVVTFILITFSIMIVSYVQIKLTQDHYYDEALHTLSQIEEIIQENAKEEEDFSYIFSLFPVNPNITYFAINSETGKIIGSTDSSVLNLDCTEVGFTYNDLEKSSTGFHTTILNKDCYCVFKKIDSHHIGYVIHSQYLYRDIPAIIGILLTCMLLMAVLLVTAFNEHIKKYVVNKLDRVNEQLFSISHGNFDQIVDVRNFHEISELSSHINSLVKTLSTNNTKLTYIFGKNNFFVGTYEYNDASRHVQFSEYIPQLFSLEHQKAQELSSNRELFQEFIVSLQEKLLPNEGNIYHVGEKYLRIDEILDKGYMLGVVVDVTSDIEKRQQLQLEIHRDSLTGLYNQIGLEEELEKIFASPKDLGHYAMITIMADSLLGINSTYGRENGDLYLRKIADLIKDFGIKNSIASRHIGGEFILFLYGYSNEAELNKTLNLLTYIQQHPIEHKNGEVSFPVIFSFGYSSSNGAEYTNYKQLLKDAIDKNYEFLSVHN